MDDKEFLNKLIGGFASMSRQDDDDHDNSGESFERDEHGDNHFQFFRAKQDSYTAEMEDVITRVLAEPIVDREDEEEDRKAKQREKEDLLEEKEKLQKMQAQMAVMKPDHPLHQEAMEKKQAFARQFADLLYAELMDNSNISAQNLEDAMKGEEKLIALMTEKKAAAEITRSCVADPWNSMLELQRDVADLRLRRRIYYSNKPAARSGGRSGTPMMGSRPRNPYIQSGGDGVRGVKVLERGEDADF